MHFPTLVPPKAKRGQIKRLGDDRVSRNANALTQNHSPRLRFTTLLSSNCKIILSSCNVQKNAVSYYMKAAKFGIRIH